jgi:hypothetical protein
MYFYKLINSEKVVGKVRLEGKAINKKWDY